MKFRLRLDSLREGIHIWAGRKANYYVLIEKSLASNQSVLDRYTFKIRTPEGRVVGSQSFQQQFHSLEECQAFIVGWINRKSGFTQK